MPDTAEPGQGERDETPAERSDRNSSELLQELRVTQTGIQILSGFLLTLPFQARFEQLDPGLVGVFLAAAAFGTLSTLLVVAPVTIHRVLFRHHAKRLLVDAADALARVGLVCLAITVTLVTSLLFGFVLGDAAGLAAGAACGVAFVVVWLALPLALRYRVPSSAGGHRP